MFESNMDSELLTSRLFRNQFYETWNLMTESFVYIDLLPNSKALNITLEDELQLLLNVLPIHIKCNQIAGARTLITEPNRVLSIFVFNSNV